MDEMSRAAHRRFLEYQKVRRRIMPFVIAGAGMWLFLLIVAFLQSMELETARRSSAARKVVHQEDPVPPHWSWPRGVGHPDGPIHSPPPRMPGPIYRDDPELVKRVRTRERWLVVTVATMPVCFVLTLGGVIALCVVSRCPFCRKRVLPRDYPTLKSYCRHCGNKIPAEFLEEAD